MFWQFLTGGWQSIIDNSIKKRKIRLHFNNFFACNLLRRKYQKLMTQLYYIFFIIIGYNNLDDKFITLMITANDRLLRKLRYNEYICNSGTVLSFYWSFLMNASCCLVSCTCNVDCSRVKSCRIIACCLARDVDKRGLTSYRTFTESLSLSLKSLQIRINDTMTRACHLWARHSDVVFSTL